ncbi:hypothetical protein Hanom_Chr12g01077261 [Helianthus anomalus]
MRGSKLFFNIFITLGIKQRFATSNLLHMFITMDNLFSGAFYYSIEICVNDRLRLYQTVV